MDRKLKYLAGVFGVLALILANDFSAFAETAGSASAEDKAKLLVSKQLLNKFVVESMDVVIKYSIFNVGSQAANNVQLKDQSFGPDFQVVGGQTEVTIGRIPPQANITHTVVVRPQKFGYYNFTSAQISYSSGEESSEILHGWSSEPGEGYIAPFREFDKRFSPHLLDWAAFAIMSVPPLLIPFMLWHSSKSKYEGVVSKKSK